MIQKADLARQNYAGALKTRPASNGAILNIWPKRGRSFFQVGELNFIRTELLDFHTEFVYNCRNICAQFGITNLLCGTGGGGGGGGGMKCASFAENVLCWE